MKDAIKDLILKGAEKAFEAGLLISDSFPDMEIEEPRHSAHGDLSTNFAMILASGQKMAPRKIAEAVINSIDDSHGIIERTEIAGPGFINFFFKNDAWHAVLKKIHQQKGLFGSSDYGKGKKVQVEFVSANPTGPLHVGHGRGAAVGDSVGNILAFAGFDVQKEYYINDSGRQIRTLGLSVWLRFLEAGGRSIEFPDDCYQGDYIKDIAAELNELKGRKLLAEDEKNGVSICARFAADKILSGIKEDLNHFGVNFDRWFSEQSLFDSGMVMDVVEDFKKKDIIYEKDGAMWFKTEEYGDAKDRVVVRNNGLTTYFASDIAYHMEKFDRGFDRVIDVWGADHHGYIQRINASIDASGRKSDQFDVILVQLVNLLRAGKPVAMSTRSGEFVTLKDIVDEVGKDAARFIFLSRSFDSGLDFDLELAKQKTSENPVYYVQYVHARISSILAKALGEGIVTELESGWSDSVAALVESEEINLIKILASFPETVEKSARTLHPHVVFTYLMRLASAFHGYYNKHKVLTEDKDITLARLGLISAVKIVIKNGLGLLGVSAPEKM
ncbi:MAG: arginine--tRNA ligase [Thermodesulfobacteriota bacterium]|nr:arginine--tRNA ligase [Thermodesulfobacteriota bacterium]